MLFCFNVKINLALKPTIYKFRIALSDMDREVYDNFSLTVAQHPSETIERMMARVLAFCLNQQESLELTKGLSEIEEPDIWVQTLDDNIALWIEVGEPDFDRVKKATRLSNEVKIYSFNSKSSVWWQQSESKFTQLNASYFRFEWEDTRKLASFVERSMDISVTISDQSAYVATSNGECEIPWLSL